MNYYKIYYEYFEEELEKYITLKQKEPTGVIIDEYTYEGLLKYLKLLFNFDDGYKLKTFKGIKLTIGNGLKLIYFY
jgi:hypothetical protein